MGFSSTGIQSPKFLEAQLDSLKPGTVATATEE